MRAHRGAPCGSFQELGADAAGLLEMAAKCCSQVISIQRLVGVREDRLRGACFAAVAFTPDSQSPRHVHTEAPCTGVVGLVVVERDGAALKVDVSASLVGR
jgi:hypothetical protein